MEKAPFSLTLNLLILSLLLLLLNPTPCLSKCNSHDRKVLFEIKAALGNPYLLESWQNTTDCCTWYCVECGGPDDRIIALVLLKGEINAQIPPQVGDLPYLQTLTFHKLSNLTGTFPNALSKLTRLREVTFSWNNLTGPVPPFFGPMKNLFSLDLSFNQLTGSIPPELAYAPNLSGLRLDRNRLTGPIPESFGYFQQREFYLFLSHNQLSGPIPNSLRNADFTYIDLSRNQITGDAYMLFKPSGSLQIIDLSRNMFAFDLSNVTFTPNLTSIDLNHNKITGNLPVQLTTLNLQYINVSYNRLCGQIPVGGKLQSFSIYEYFHNKCLCGSPLPECK
ncbi:Leucine-rich repeat-containing N-terminal, plant-type [Dillenia turbinata]|uniref:Leucine-rich repeat-containing N-terminal, plant-type n=1 Tax=Dillenia turbinata TaxID=194707 RepID=A0AAN8ZPH2_9MAGN